MRRLFHVAALLLLFASISADANAESDINIFAYGRAGVPFGLSADLSIFLSKSDPCLSFNGEIGLSGGKAQVGVGWYSAEVWQATSIRASAIRSWSNPLWGQKDTTYVGFEIRFDSIFSLSFGPYVSLDADEEEWIGAVTIGIPFWVL